MIRQIDRGLAGNGAGGGREDAHWVPSVGIDIGTSTTKMIVSRLKLSRTSGALSLPRYEITDRQLAYESPIYATPLRGDDEVDAERIGDILAAEYAQAGVRPSELKSGAVIITGETANKHNARRIVHLLAERAGDFVVATAGADLEGLLAGKGAGAEARSRQTRGAVVNIDIGGGTANAALFRRGKPVGTVTFRVGGRLLQVSGDGVITAISPSLRKWLDAAGFRLRPGTRATFDVLRELCAAMCRDMLDYLAGVAGAADRATLQALLLGAPLGHVPADIEEWTISGGIGRLMEAAKPRSLEQTAVYGDIGPLLAHTLKEQAALYPIRLGRPEQTVRATVIGAGMQSTEISGATVHLDAGVLPLRNLPVVRVELTPALLSDPGALNAALQEAMRQGGSLYEREASPPFALAIAGTQPTGYAELQRLSGAIAESYLAGFPDSRVIAVLSEGDIAKALGQSLKIRFGESPRVISIDQIQAGQGDYVDLGEPISGMVIPVVVKTLAFGIGMGVTES